MKALKKILGIPDKNYKIFVVEDSDIFRDLLSVFVKDVDKKENLKGNVKCEVHSFRTGEECINALDEKPDIVVLDYQLATHRTDAKKIMNGVETLRTIKRIQPSVEGIIVTAKGDFNVNTTALEAGAAEYIEKGPGIREKLQNTITSLIDKLSGADRQTQVAF